MNVKKGWPSTIYENECFKRAVQLMLHSPFFN
jgi:hypothetical protein